MNSFRVTRFVTTIASGTKLFRVFLGRIDHRPTIALIGGYGFDVHHATRVRGVYHLQRGTNAFAAEIFELGRCRRKRGKKGGGDDEDEEKGRGGKVGGEGITTKHGGGLESGMGEGG